MSDSENNYNQKKYTSDEELVDRLGFHKGTPEVQTIYTDIRQRFIDLALHLNNVVPEGPEKSLGMTALKQAQMWSISSVACNLTPLVEEG